MARISGAYRDLNGPGDSAIAMLAARQHGVVSTWQLKDLGYSQSAIWRRAKAGRLHRVHHGVYAVGHTRITLKGRWMAAVLACGPEAVLSHQSAAALWDLRPIPRGSIHVTAPGHSTRVRANIRIHGVRTFHDDDRAMRDGITVTSVARTLLDYAEAARRQQLRSALEAAERMDLLDGSALDAVTARSPGRRGLKPLTQTLDEMRDLLVPWTQSQLEARFLELVREAGLPEPQVNVHVAGELVDFFWPAQRLVIEVDAYRYHKTRSKFEADRRKDAKVQLAGHRVARVTDVRIAREAEAVKRDVRALLDV